MNVMHAGSSKLKCPCDKNCAERSATCHATCKRYAEFTAARNVELEERHKKIRKTLDLPNSFLRRER